MTKKPDGLIYESPDGGKTVYARERGSLNRHLVYTDAVWKSEEEKKLRWTRLKAAVWLAEHDPTINDALSKLEMLITLKGGD